jgi:hypothetical protein
MLNSTRMSASLARATAEAFKKDAKKAKTLVRLEAAVTQGDITREEIEVILAGLPVYLTKTAGRPDLNLHIAPGWDVIDQQGQMLIVRAANGRVGHTSTSNDWSWVCPSCGLEGPWSGVVCLSCGQKSDPGD